MFEQWTTASINNDKPQAQLTRIVALGTAVIISLRVFFMFLIDGHIPVLLTSIIALLLLAFGLSRTKHYRIGSALNVIAIFIIPYALFYQRHLNMDDSPIVLTFAFSAVAMAFLFFDMRVIGLVVMANLLTLIIIGTRIVPLSVDDLALVLGANSLASLLIIIASISRYRDRKMIVEQTQANNESEARYRTLFDAAFESLIIHDNGKIIDINPAAEKLFGYTSAQIKGKYLYELITDTLAMPNVEAWNQDEVVPYESVGLKNDGDVIPIEVFTKSFSYDGSDVRVSAVRDITYHKQYEAQLHRRVALEKLISEISRRFTYLPSEIEKIKTSINKTLKDISQYVGADRSFAFLSFEETGSYTYEWASEDQNVPIDISGVLPSSMWLWWKDKFQSGEKIVIPNVAEMVDDEEKIRNALQVYGIQSSLIMPLRYRDRLIGFIGFATIQQKTDWSDEDAHLLNITAEIFVNAVERARAENARKRADHWFRKIFSNSPLPIAITRVSDSGFIDVNDSFVKLVGYSRDEIINTTTYSIGLWEESDKNPWKTEEIKDNPFTNRETRIKTKNDDIRDVLISLENVDLNGEDSMIMIMSDITQRKQVEAHQRAFAMEREQVEILHKFISEVSHDFKTPLSTMRTSTYLIEKKLELEQPVQQHLDILNIEFDQLQRLLEGLLTMSRLDQIDTSDFQFKLYDLNTLVREVSNQQHILLKEHGHTLNLDFADFADMIPIDNNAINRAIMNVLINAYIYTPVNGEITLRTTHKGNYAIIEVVDNGVGISPDELPFIFNRFYKVNKARTSGTSGTGLGLPIARRIIEAHHGYITASSELGVGSTFEIGLPFNHELARLHLEKEPQTV